MIAEGAVGLAAGLAAGSIALVGWALGSAIEGLASVIVVWRFTGSRMLSPTAERRAQKAVAVSFWLLAPYIAFEAIRDLIGHRLAAHEEVMTADCQPQRFLLQVGLFHEPMRQTPQQVEVRPTAFKAAGP